MGALIIPLGLVCVIIACITAGNVLTGKKVAAMRANGTYPEAGKEKEKDVLRLVKSGDKILAIRCYRSLHKVSARKAKKHVEQLARQNA